MALKRNQGSIGSTHKHGIGAAVFILPDHVVHPFEAAEIEGCRRAKVDQRVYVHIAAEMDLVVPVDGHGDAVVAVPGDIGREPPPGLEPFPLEPIEVELGLAQYALADSHFAFGVVEGDKLAPFVGEQIEADGMPGPNG